MHICSVVDSVLDHVTAETSARMYEHAQRGNCLLSVTKWRTE